MEEQFAKLSISDKGTQTDFESDSDADSNSDSFSISDASTEIYVSTEIYTGTEIDSDSDTCALSDVDEKNSQVCSEQEIISWPGVTTPTEKPPCNHHMSFDFNIVEMHDIIYDERHFRHWFKCGEVTCEILDMLLYKENPSVNIFLTYMIKHADYPAFKNRNICYPRYEDFVNRRYRKLHLKAIIPYGEKSVDLILKKGPTYFYIPLQGIRNHFIFELKEIKPEYYINPHPNRLINIKCPVTFLALTKSVKENTQYILAQQGSQALLITLYPSPDFALITTYIDPESEAYKSLSI